MHPLGTLYPKPLPMRKLKLPEETGKVIKKDLIVKIKNERFNLGREEARRVKTIDLSVDHQTSQFAYWANTLKNMNLSDVNMSRFMKALNSRKEEPGKYLDLNPKQQKELDQIFHGMTHAARIRGKGQYYRSKKLDYIKSGSIRAQVGGQSVAPSALINARYQIYSSENSLLNNQIATCEALRAGVLNDIQDPGNTIPELESYLNDPSTVLLDKEIHRREKEIHSALKLKTRGSKHKIWAIQDSLVPLYQIKEFKKTQDPALKAAVVRKINEKKRFIDDQMLQMVMIHVSQNLDSLEGDTFTFTFEGLLNELKTKKKHTIESSGLIMDEGNNLREMEAAFQRFSGKKLIFDHTGPYLDKEGHIHLPYPLPKHKVMTLEPILLNLTVNGSTTNNPIQAKINKEAIKQLTTKIETLTQNHPELEKPLREIQRKMNKVQIELHKGNSNFEMASELLAAQFLLRNLMKKNKLGCFAISLGCYSAKDRTAVVMELGILQMIDPKLEKQPHLGKEKIKQIRAKLVGLITNPKGMSAEIVYENTGVRVVKYMELLLPCQKKTISSLAKAVLYKIKQAKTLVNPPNLE